MSFVHLPHPHAPAPFLCTNRTDVRKLHERVERSTLIAKIVTLAAQNKQMRDQGSQL